MHTEDGIGVFDVENLIAVPGDGRRSLRNVSHMKPGLHSLLIPEGHSFAVAARLSSCWIDSLPNHSERDISVIRDYLSSEWNIALPSPDPSDQLFGFLAVSSLTQHEANCLRTRLQKKCPEFPLGELLRCYGYSGDGGNEWVHYLCRQCRHFSTGGCRVVLLATTDDFTEGTLNPCPR